MKTWVSTLLALLAGYLIYNTWFATDETEEPTVDAPRILEVAPPDGGTSDGTDAEAAADRDQDQPRRSFDLDSKPVGPAATQESVADRAAADLDKKRHAAIENGNDKRAAQLAQQILSEYPETRAAGWVNFEFGREHYHAYQSLGRTKAGLERAKEAWKYWTKALLFARADGAEKDELRARLDKLAKDLLFTSRHIEGIDRMHTPRRGDTLEVLCKKTFRNYGARTSPGFVAAVNGMRSPKDLRAREPIRVPLGTLSIRVVKHEFRLYVLLDDCYVRSFGVGLGRQGGTPVTTFVVGGMNKNPDWYPKPGLKIPFGDSRNILGTRWIGFRNTPEHRGFGIHGTSDPSSIGREESSGCVRMLNREVEILFDWLTPGTKIAVVR